MKLHKNTYLSVFQIVIYLLCFPIVLYSQQEFQYEGPLEIGKYKGEGSYGYRVANGDTILDGSFQMFKSNLQALLEKEDASFSILGSFDDDYPVGFWQFQFGEFQSESKSQVVDFQYRVKVSGVQEEASGRIKKGKPDGPWTYSVRQIKDSEVERLLFKSAIDFANGLPRQSFRIENDSSTLVGRFLRNGLAHDEWILFSSTNSEGAERWTFDDGLLESIAYDSDGITKEVQVFKNSSQRTKTINLDGRYLKTIQMHVSNSDSLTLLELDLPKLLNKNAAYYQKIDTILSSLGKSSFMPDFKVKIPYHPLDSLEAKVLDTIQVAIENSKQIADSFLNDSHLNILKLSDEEALYSYLLTERISKDFIDPLLKMKSYAKEGMIEFIDHKELKRKLWPNGLPSKEIRVTVAMDGQSSEKVYTLPNSQTYDFELDGIKGIGQISKYTLHCLDFIKQGLAAKLTNQRRQSALIALEEELVLQNKTLQQLIDSSASDLPPQYLKALQRIKAVSDADLSEFSNQEELKLARQLVKCHEQMNLLAQVVADQPKKSKEITNTYIDRIWNPFMASLMDEEVKKRITTAYRKVLTPYFLKRIQNDLDCSNVEQLLLQIASTNERMIALRNEDTAKIERKLRREDNPEEVMKLFKVQSQMSDEN